MLHAEGFHLVGIPKVVVKLLEKLGILRQVSFLGQAGASIGVQPVSIVVIDALTPGRKYAAITDWPARRP